MTPSRDMVLDWVQDWAGVGLTPAEQSDVLRAAGHDTDRAEAVILAFATKFGVDMAGYRPPMHAHGAGQSLRPDWPVPMQPPHGVVVPLSVSLLHAAALARRWPVIYPTLPLVRDLSVLNVPLLMAGLVGAALLVLAVVPWVL